MWQRKTQSLQIVFCATSADNNCGVTQAKIRLFVRSQGLIWAEVCMYYPDYPVCRTLLQSTTTEGETLTMERNLHIYKGDEVACT